MNFVEILIAVISTVVGLLTIAGTIIGFFLKRDIAEVEMVHNQCEENTLDIAVLTKDHENKHEALSKSMSELSMAIKENTIEHKEFRKDFYEDQKEFRKNIYEKLEKLQR